MVIAMVVNVVSYVLAVASSLSVPHSLVLALTDLSLSALCLYAALAVINKTPRFQQAFTALAGGTAVLNLAAVPIFWLNASAATPAFGLSNFVIILWGLAIIAHVLKHTLEVTAWISAGLAFGFYVIVLNLMAITGVIGGADEGNVLDSQTSIYQSVTGDWLGRA